MRREEPRMGRMPALGREKLSRSGPERGETVLKHCFMGQDVPHGKNWGQRARHCDIVMRCTLVYTSVLHVGTLHVPKPGPKQSELLSYYSIA